MRWKIICGLISAILFVGSEASRPLPSGRTSSEEKAAASFINRVEAELKALNNEAYDAAWAYESNINDQTEAAQVKMEKKSDKFSQKSGAEANEFDMEQIHQQQVYRKLKSLRNIGSSKLPADKIERYNEITRKMAKIYSTAKIKDPKDSSKLMSLEPEITEVLQSSRDPKELERVWVDWRDATGVKMRDLYVEYVDLINEAARLNGFRDATEMKVQSYESDSFTVEMQRTWDGLLPLYQQFHAYVRHKLQNVYGKDVVPDNKPIPAHLMGNMWAQSWGHLTNIIKPFPNKPDVDVSDKMVADGWTAKKIFETSDDFFQSLGFEPMTKTFWEKSILEKPDDGREMVCHASAWDFYRKDDYRIKQCTRVNQEDFVTAHHEMGHIQYFMVYSNQSTLFREGANPGFHEAVGDTISLAVETPTYYKRLGLLDNNFDITDEETNINILFNTALKRLVFLPFGYLVDKYRWDLYSDWAQPETQLNCHWVDLRAKIQGIAPPVKRNENQFDAGAKYHVAAQVGYVRYFLSHIYQFQFYKAMCEISGQYVPNDPAKPLHLCNFYGSKKAGARLIEMLEKGSSLPWKDAITLLTGEPKMDAGAFREYFKPLEEWLKKENARNGVKVGWEYDINEYCDVKPRTENSARGMTLNFAGLLISTVVSMKLFKYLLH